MRHGDIELIEELDKASPMVAGTTRMPTEGGAEYVRGLATIFVADVARAAADVGPCR